MAGVSSGDSIFLMMFVYDSGHNNECQHISRYLIYSNYVWWLCFDVFYLFK